MKLSIVTTLYKSSVYINEFYSRISQEVTKITDNYEIIFVDDGSPDDSLSKVIKIGEKDHHVKVIELSRNFGHHEAIIAGLNYSTGDYIYLLDVDLEDKPEWLSIFYNHLITNNCDVVYGKQKKRSGNYFRKFFGNLWYKIIKNILKVEHDENVCTARIMTRNYVNQLNKFEEKFFVLTGIFYQTGFKQEPFLIEKKFRNISNYDFLKKISITLKFIVGNSNIPLFFIAFLNLITSILSMFISFFIFVRSLYIDGLLPGWSSIVFLISLFYFLISLSISTISLYLVSINQETKKRPRYIVKSIK